MDILRVQVRWTGFSGAPGYTALHFAGGGGLITDAQQVAERVDSALAQLSPVVAAGVDFAVDTEVARLDSDSGEMLEVLGVTGMSGRTGSATGPYSAASGAVINWRTNDVRFGRRIRGRSFIVPLGNTAYDSQGTLAGPTLASLGSFASEIVGGDFDSEFGVWSRPKDGTGGVFATVTSYNVPDMAAVLRSRRD